MSFWKRIFRRKGKNSIPGVIEEGEEQAVPVFHRENISIHNKQEREQYIRSALEQIADAERELRHLEYEYNLVTSHLTDIEELERLPGMMRMEIREVAEKLCDKVAIIKNGRLAASGPMDQVRGDESLEQVFLELVDDERA